MLDKYTKVITGYVHSCVNPKYEKKLPNDNGCTVCITNTNLGNKCSTI